MGAVARRRVRPSRRLCDRIINAQKDEINIMQTWLRDRGQPVPEAKPVPMKMMMDGMEHEMLMPGMLTDEQLKQLDAARGSEFDTLFLSFMIQHHQGAVSMVEDLLVARRRRAGRARVQVQRPTSTSIRRPRSRACSACSR